MPPPMQRGLNPLETRRIAERELCSRSLSRFIRASWPILEPNAEYVHGWHIDALAEHLEAVTFGQINRLLINIPPGTMKSLSVGVLWPMWEWGPRNLPGTRFVGMSHSHELAIRDNVKCRRLVQSEWYQDRWGDRVTLMDDQNVKTKFENTATGFRQVVPITSATGVRGDRVIVDDPHTITGSDSDVKRESVCDTFFYAVSNRLNDMDASAIIIVMQRIHERDLSGQILAKQLGYEHLMLPMEFEPDRKCFTSIGWEDPRTEPGELLFPERFSADVVEREKRVMGSIQTAGQYQQRPAPAEGGMFKRAWFETVDAVPSGGERVRAWDLGATEGGGDHTAGLLMKKHDGVFYIEHVERLQGSAARVERTIVNTASRDGADVRIHLPQDPGQAGKAQVLYLTQALAGYRVKAEPVTGAKVTRALPVSAQAEAGNVKLVRGDWNDAFLDEINVFPNGSHDDQVDALADAFTQLIETKPEWNIL